MRQKDILKWLRKEAGKIAEEMEIGPVWKTKYRAKFKKSKTTGKDIINYEPYLEGVDDIHPINHYRRTKRLYKRYSMRAVFDYFEKHGLVPKKEEAD